ncbi:MAG: DUF5074 domain-containing protein [Massilibacteroides sp.]|nr:DUF5074 domain-containing protein [Massilibacteroides sp.]MDD3063746.1 DUF5074 domain-containing protein [Massilibacteroides sp.]MDD4114754.1 DUF5074 domain-containing protein [Massilibacteroides sp.]MDD4659902.1 DUF5074 domain-containing protein [Massilibacteroides sp.]
MKKLALFFVVFFFSLTLFAQEEAEYTKGVFFVNEDWYGHQNSTVNFLSEEGEWTYRVFQKINPGKELGCTSQFGIIYGDKFYVVSKQEKDPGASITGSRFVVCDAKTMKCLKDFQTIAVDDAGKSIADGRSFLGVNEKKGYIGTSNGIWLYDIEKMEIGEQIEGTGNPNEAGYGQLYYAQIGTMVRTEDYVFAVHQQKGLLVIDPEKDQVLQVIAPPEYEENGKTKLRGFGSVVQSKDGHLWISMAANTTGSGATLPYIFKINPYTFEVDTIAIPNEDGIEDIPNSWYAWTADGFCASTQENKIYWNGNNGNSWFKGRRIFCYDIDKNTFSKVYDFEEMPGDWVLYGVGFRIHPLTDEFYCSLFHEFQDPTYEVARIANNGALLNEYSMITNYWFPALPVFPDNYEPQVEIIPDQFCGIGRTCTLPLNVFVSDADNISVSIVKSVVNNTAPEIFEANVKNGQLVVSSISSQTGEGKITLRFNSNGHIVDRILNVTVEETGTDVNEVEAAHKKIFYSNRLLTLENYESYRMSIFNLEGMKVADFVVLDRHFTRTLILPQGIYIVYGSNGSEVVTRKIRVK